MRISTVFPVLLVLASAVSAFGQEDNTRGLQLGLHGGMTSWNVDDIEGNTFDTESGFHVGADLGWGMSDWLGLFVRVDRTSISSEVYDSYPLTHLDIGIRAVPQFFGLTIRPYAEVLASVRTVSLTESNGFEIKASGVGFGGGLGLFVFLSEKFALQAGLAAVIGNFDEVKFADVPVPDVSANSGRLMAGFTFFP